MKNFTTQSAQILYLYVFMPEHGDKEFEKIADSDDLLVEGSIKI